jgi:hypothetical protein
MYRDTLADVFRYLFKIPSIRFRQNQFPDIQAPCRNDFFPNAAYR